ncbi:LysM peptidoglycan-binding domain-containing protein [Azotobacter chroococcum]|uniref:LysM peptidoglycan-binding domain-containing protein n=1 Tax=Azotobacter chroococcum TaxID=353 RepID=A0AA43Z9X3_9GAMM|nr:LysM peptidoglycan-binding domain-containing protein [Azotobacter chroococcum]NHN79645.1 LysM peptidoglycan-binding domain-containing protein [Azotobacter chroococcum]
MDPIEAFMQANALTTPLFPPTSRYHGIAAAQLTLPDGTTVAYLKRRFVPPPENFALLQEHMVAAGDRLDNLAARYLGDPQQYWRICDANGAMRPDELTETAGRRLRITLPEGIPGAPDAG